MTQAGLNAEEGSLEVVMQFELTPKAWVRI